VVFNFLRQILSGDIGF